MRALLLLAVLPVLSPAQERNPDTRQVYKVDFVIRDSATTAGVHKLTLLVEDHNGSGKVRTGTRVPVTLDAIDAKGGAGRRTDYVDVGLNLDCQIHSTDERVHISTEVEMSSLRKPEPGVPGSMAAPAISNVRTKVRTSVKPGQPVMIARVEDAAAKRTVEVEATATPLN